MIENVGIIVQARMGSTRLQGKLTIPFLDQGGILEFLLNRIRIEIPEIPLVVAIPDTKENDTLFTLISRLEIPVFRGSETDVLDRFVKAADYFRFKNLIRICSDNPFLSVEAIKDLVVKFGNQPMDYFGFITSKGVPSIRTHFGFWPEMVSLEALKKVKLMTKENYYREHVTNFLYENGEIFKLGWIPIKKDLDENAWARFTIDTQNDFENAQFIGKLCRENEISPEPLALINLVSNYPEIRAKMQREMEKNSK